MALQTPITLMHHTHWDREWYAPMRAYQYRLLRVLEALQQVVPSTLPCFTLDGQTVLLDDALELRPALKPWLLEQIQREKLEVGPWFVMPDVVLVSGESLLRNLALGIQSALAWGAKPPFCGYLPDPFGMPAAMPKVLQHMGIANTIVWRGVHPQSALSPVFNWRADDGSTVLAYHMALGYFQNIFHDPALSAEAKQDALRATYEALAKQPFAEQLGVLLPVGGDHLGALNADQLAALNLALSQLAPQVTPKTLTIKQWMAHVAQMVQANAQLQNAVPEHLGELRDATPGAPYLLSGVWSSRLYLKQLNRRLEHQLTHQVERLWSLVAAHTHAQASADLPCLALPLPELALCWRLTLLNQPHDSICGCSVDEVHTENETRAQQALQLAEALKAEALYRLEEQVNRPANAFIVHHTGQHRYWGVVPFTWRGEWPEAFKACDALQIQSQGTALINHYLQDISDVPMADRTEPETHGWLWIDPQQALMPVSVQAIMPQAKLSAPAAQVCRPNPETLEWTLENGMLRVRVQQNLAGILVEDLSTQQVYGPLLTVTTSVETGDSYNPGVPQPVQSAVLVSVTPKHPGPLVAALTLEYTLPTGERFWTDILLAAGQRQLEFESRWTIKTENVRLAVAFETGLPISDVIEEAPFGTFKRSFKPFDNSELALFKPVAKGDEWQAPTGPIQRWISCNGHTLLTEGLTEYWVSAPQVCLTLHRGFGILSSDTTGTRGGHAGPPMLTPGGQALSRAQAFRYAWVLPDASLPEPEALLARYAAADRFYGIAHATGRDRPDASASHNVAANAALTFSAFNLDALNPSLVLSALTPLPSGELMMRVFNPLPKPQPLLLIQANESKPTSEHVQSRLIRCNGFGEPLSEHASLDGSAEVIAAYALVSYLVLL
ncbi:MAG: glycoside hydrolase family 38 C-terminal domain-containing protein [Vampirovibrionales bacterium]|nr:glycoside hydrolase family 38 C-terminal domain-containing protein [Vampirovibrionales bacterium]